jgi:hypothetical protein
MSPLDLNKDLENETPITESIVSVNTESTSEIINSEEVRITENDYNTLSLNELIEVLKDIVVKDVEEVKDDVENIKQIFYKKRKVEIEEFKKAYLEEGGEEESFTPVKSEIEESFKVILNEFRSKKSALTAQIEKEKEKNLQEKQAILTAMKSMVENDSGDASTHIKEFKALQEKWRTIGQIPQTAVNELWKQYNLYQESFWDLIKINNEMREYDFKKNLEAKTLICDAAEKLANETDVILAFQKLQKLHEEWHDLGPVSRELREQIWSRFKEATSVINKKHQGFYDAQRKIEEDNLELKNALCEKIESFDYSQCNNYKAWDEATKTMLEWQAQWKSIGFAPRKVNQKIFERYRKACDAFFAAKSEFYKQSKNELNVNADKKKALCEQAEALKDSTEWKATADKLSELQKEWKTIGPVAKKLSDELWARFIGACDYFFQQKNKSTSNHKSIEHENLAKKNEMIAKVNAFVKTENHQESVQLLKDMMNEWNTIGHVPFKEKDKVYKEFRAAIDNQFELLNAGTDKKRANTPSKGNYKDGGKKEHRPSSERDKLYKAYEHLKSEIATYENNIGFFTSSSKKGGGLIKEMEDKITTLKQECKKIELQIIELDEKG